jgi:hypothetical protein
VPCQEQEHVVFPFQLFQVGIYGVGVCVHAPAPLLAVLLAPRQAVSTFT